MKIGIMTFWWSNDNYGQQLQLYALQKYLCDMGHDAYLIRYRVQKKKLLHYAKKALNVTLLIRWVLNHSKVSFEQKKHDRHFEDFRKKYIRQSELFYSSIEELRKNPPLADAYIVGSDQVWNTFQNPLKTIKMRIHAYFLDFGKPETKRLSYAASWGMNSLSDEFCNEIKPLLERFDYVSVREKSGIELCRLCGRSDAEFVCDPTLLLDANAYRSLYNGEKNYIPKKKYVFVYLLKNQCEASLSEIFDLAHKKGLSVVYVTGNGRIDDYEKTFPTVQGWLALLDNAQYVLTNSFHCAVFSTIFHKPFGVFPIVGKNSAMNNRFDSLFEMTGVGDHYIKNSDYSVLQKDYEVNKPCVSPRFLEALGGSRGE